MSFSQSNIPCSFKDCIKHLGDSLMHVLPKTFYSIGYSKEYTCRNNVYTIGCGQNLQLSCSIDRVQPIMPT